MIPYMHAIDFNTWMTLLSMTRECVVDPEVMKYAKVQPENILPQFPRDLTKFVKPSIIIQKVATEQSDLCFGKGYLGQTWSDEDDGFVDVFSRQHEITYQYDVFADTNSQVSLITDIITERILGVDVREIPLLDFTGEGEPVTMGLAQVKNDIDIVPINAVNSDESRDYRTAIRFYLNVIQTVVPAQEFVDLAKWIKISQHVKL